MFGAFPFGAPYFAQGTGQRTAAALAASAGLSVSSTGALTKPAAQLTSTATFSFSVSAGFVAGPPQFLAQATIAFATTAALTKPAASFAASASLRVSTTAGPPTGVAAALASAATVSITTAGAVLTGNAAQLAGHATLSFTVSASALSGAGAALTASATLHVLVTPPPLTSLGAAAALVAHATLAVTTTGARLTGIRAALAAHPTLRVTSRGTLSDLVAAATVLINTSGTLTRPANADEKACGAPFPIDPAVGAPPCTGPFPIDPDRPVPIPAAFEAQPTLAVTTRRAALAGVAAVLSATSSWRLSTHATATSLANPIAATATLRVLVTALPPAGIAARLTSVATSFRLTASVTLSGGSPVLSASASLRVLVTALPPTGVAAALATSTSFAVKSYGTLANTSIALATTARLCLASPGALLELARYVATTGLDTNPGTWALPYRTITKGVSVLLPGNLLSIRGGTYDEGLDSCPSGTSWSNPVRIAAYQNEVVWMKPTTPLSGNPGACVRFNTGAEHHIEFDGIHMDGSTAGVYDTVAFIASPSGEPHHVRIKNATIIAMRTDNSAFSDFAAHGIEYHGGLPTLIGGFEFINLRITGGGRPFNGDFSHNGYAIYLAGPNCLVDGCDLSDNKGAGVHIFNDDGQSPDNNIVRNCTIHDQSRNSNIGQLWGILNVGSNNRIYNNLVYNIFGPGTDPGGQGLAIASSNNEVQDNTVYACTQYGILVGAGSLRRRAPLPPLPTPQAVGTLVRNNIAYNNGNDYANLGTTTVHTNNLDDGTNPLFTNEATHDFTVKPGSPAILAGVGVAYINTDLTGRPRPTAGPCTIGAYEFVATREGRG
jgi:hypothetical protein